VLALCTRGRCAHQINRYLLFHTRGWCLRGTCPHHETRTLCWVGMVPFHFVCFQTLNAIGVMQAPGTIKVAKASPGSRMRWTSGHAKHTTEQDPVPTKSSVANKTTRGSHNCLRKDTHQTCARGSKQAVAVLLSFRCGSLLSRVHCRSGQHLPSQAVPSECGERTAGSYTISHVMAQVNDRSADVGLASHTPNFANSRYSFERFSG
jgi:hypothetical protein